MKKYEIEKLIERKCFYWATKSQNTASDFIDASLNFLSENGYLVKKLPYYEEKKQVFSLTRQERIAASVRNAIAECRHKGRIISIDLEQARSYDILKNYYGQSNGLMDFYLSKKR